MISTCIFMIQETNSITALYIENPDKKTARMTNGQTLLFRCSALGGIRTPGRRGTGNHRSIRLSYERICNLM